MANTTPSIPSKTLRADDRGHEPASPVPGDAAQLPVRCVAVCGLAGPTAGHCDRRGSARLSDRAERDGFRRARRIVPARGVTLRYKDYRRDDPERQRVMTISPDEFIRRFGPQGRDHPGDHAMNRHGLGLPVSSDHRVAGNRYLRARNRQGAKTLRWRAWFQHPEWAWRRRSAPPSGSAQPTAKTHLNPKSP